MIRTLFDLTLFLSLAVPLRAEDVDPEPPTSSGVARSGGLVVRAEKNGTVTVTKAGKAQWSITLKDGFNRPSQVVIANGRAIVARDCIQMGIDLLSGTIIWVRKGDLAKAKLTAGADRV